MAFSTLRREDERMARVIEHFLDENFYCKVETFERVNDKSRQVVGIDTIFKLRNFEYVCDEKAAVRYIGKKLNTFSFELSFISNDDTVRDGWLLSADEVNNSFLLCWIDKAKTDNLSGGAGDIQEMEIALVKKKKILDYLSLNWWTRDKLLKKAERIRANENEALGNIDVNGCRFVISRNLVEKPVNVLIDRKTIISMADYSTKYTM